MSEHHHFAFVHGAGHGGWCWYKLANSLRENGHKATCIDLKGAGINLTDPNTVSSLDDYNQPLYDFLSQLPLDQKVILVSHSVGGGSMTAAMCQYPSKVSMAVYVAAAMVKPGTIIPPILKEVLKICSGMIETEAEKIWDFTFGNGPENLPTSIVDIPAAPEADKIPRVYVKTGKDNMFQSSRQDLMVTLWPPAQYFLLEESDHSAFFSQPEALYKILTEAASSISP
ncbi:hypothetical protein HID58_004916 [Brassica napus]|uniref:AB hydrolase-1 domain-containing protein n=1 Tax=Brassica napus TaxID=3708 RepID=A0ABQ8E752_BRANA|nr:hypothetical protein HID58_004916 [Brassica napus]